MEGLKWTEGMNNNCFYLKNSVKVSLSIPCTAKIRLFVRKKEGKIQSSVTLFN